MSRRDPPHCQDALRWLKDRGWSLAPLTGQDYSALTALAHCWQLWTRGDEAGRECALDAAAALLDGCQEVCWPMARELVAQAGDWSHRDVVWAKVAWRFGERMRERHGSMVSTGDIERMRRLERCHVGNSLVYREGEA